MGGALTYTMSIVRIARGTGGERRHFVRLPFEDSTADTPQSVVAFLYDLAWGVQSMPTGVGAQWYGTRTMISPSFCVALPIGFRG